MRFALCGRAVYIRQLHAQSLVLRFSEDELNALQDRFAVLSGKLKYTQACQEPMFGAWTSKYGYYDQPEGFGVDEFVASWDDKG